MSNRILFFLAPAGASSFFYVLLGQVRAPRLKNRSYYLPTIPEKHCMFFPPDTNCPDTGWLVPQFIENEPTTKGHEAYSLNAGWPVAPPWRLEQIKQMPDNWKFINLIRDGRNQIESLRSKETKAGLSWDQGEFLATCRGWQSSARNALDCQKEMPDRYKIFRFEYLIANPVGAIENMFAFVGLKLNRKKVQDQLTALHNKDWKPNTNCGRLDNVNYRWHNWHRGDKQGFKNIAEQEILELGYLPTEVD